MCSQLYCVSSACHHFSWVSEHVSVWVNSYVCVCLAASWACWRQRAGCCAAPDRTSDIWEESSSAAAASHSSAVQFQHLEQRGLPATHRLDLYICICVPLIIVSIHMILQFLIYTTRYLMPGSQTQLLYIWFMLCSCPVTLSQTKEAEPSSANNPGTWADLGAHSAIACHILPI